MSEKVEETAKNIELKSKQVQLYIYINVTSKSNIIKCNSLHVH